jgi:hypothetical protein
MAGPAFPLDVPLHPDLPILTQWACVFAKLTRRLKRGTFRSVVDLQVATNRFVGWRRTSIPNPSSGPPIRSASSPQHAGTKR